MPEAFRRKPLFYAAILFSLGILLQNYFLPEPIPQDDLFWQAKYNGSILLKGDVVSEVDERWTSYGDENVTFVLRAKNILNQSKENSKNVTGLVKCTLTNPDEVLSYGDEVLIKGELTIPKGARNPGGFDKRAYLDRMGIRTLFYGDRKSNPEILSRGHGHFVREKSLEAKQFLSKTLSEEFSPRDAAFLKALFLGERSGLEEDFKDLFIKTGTMHILAVSGFNIGFLIVTLLFLSKPFSIPKNTRYGIMIFVVWFYCLLVGWQAPVVRASFMATVFIAGQLLGRKTNILNTLGFAALVILMVNPKQLFDVGFELSFLAVYAIAEFLPLFISPLKLLPNEKWTVKERFILYLEELFWISFVCLLATLPVTIQNFYIVTPLSLLANMIVVPLSFLIFFAGVCFFLTFGWVGKFLPIIPFSIKLGIELFTRCLMVIENLPGAYFVCGKLNPALWALLAGGIFYFLYSKQMENKIARALVLILFIGCILLSQAAFREFHKEFKMTVFDVGQGDAIYFEFPVGGNLLIDAGKGGDGDRGRWVIKPFLWSKGIRSIDAVVATHPQEDHVGGMAAVFDEFKIGHMIDAGMEYDSKTFQILKSRVEKKKVEHWVVHEGGSVEGFPEIGMFVLHPPSDEAPDKNVNNDCVVLKIIYKETSFLLTGDIEKKAMAHLLSEGGMIKSDVLKVPHHGAKLDQTGGEFVKAVGPKISVISVGEKNKFHHPASETLKILESISGNKVFRTDQDAAVEIVSDGHKVTARHFAVSL